jgi:hypothetical protein
MRKQQPISCGSLRLWLHERARHAAVAGQALTLLLLLLLLLLVLLLLFDDVTAGEPGQA